MDSREAQVAEYRKAIGTAQAVAKTEVAEGARRAWQRYLADEDRDMATEAEDRLWRVLDGTATEVDIFGAIDWL